LSKGAYQLNAQFVAMPTTAIALTVAIAENPARIPNLKVVSGQGGAQPA